MTKKELKEFANEVQQQESATKSGENKKPGFIKKLFQGKSKNLPTPPLPMQPTETGEVVKYLKEVGEDNKLVHKRLDQISDVVLRREVEESKKDQPEQIQATKYAELLGNMKNPDLVQAFFHLKNDPLPVPLGKLQETTDALSRLGIMVEKISMVDPTEKKEE